MIVALYYICICELSKFYILHVCPICCILLRTEGHSLVRAIQGYCYLPLLCISVTHALEDLVHKTDNCLNVTYNAIIAHRCPGCADFLLQLVQFHFQDVLVGHIPSHPAYRSKAQGQAIEDRQAKSINTQSKPKP